MKKYVISLLAVSQLFSYVSYCATLSSKTNTHANTAKNTVTNTATNSNTNNTNNISDEKKINLSDSNIQSELETVIYFKNKNSKLEVISGEEFTKCEDKIYRVTAQEYIHPILKKDVLEASLHGETIDDFHEVTAQLNSKKELCAWFTDQEHAIQE